MDTRKIARRPEPCNHENCGSRRFHLGEDGFTYCDQGHQQSERGTVVAEDIGELQTHGRKSRRQSSDEREVVRRTLSGARAFEHYLLCYQLILWKQLRWLIDVQKLPAELEIVIRDLWALRLQNLQNRVSYDSDTDTEGLSQRFSSQSEGETATETEASQSRRRRRKRKDGSPVLVEALALMYVGGMLLRTPLTVADLHAWVGGGELLYYRAVTALPANMRGRLPGEYQVLLDPQDLLRPETVHNTIFSLVTGFSQDFGMAVPPLNKPLVLCKWVTELSLPIEVYAATGRLASILGVDFAYQVDSKTGSNIVLRYPEAQLMSLLVVATKLLFPFDEIMRTAYASTDLSALSLDWDAWAAVRSEQSNDARTLGYSEALQASEAAVLDMADDELDQYMSWYEQHMASEEVREHGRAGRDADFRKAMFRSFPVRQQHPPAAQATQSAPDAYAATLEKVRRVQSILEPTRIVPSGAGGAEDVLRAGSFYRRYRKFAELGGHAKKFYETAAAVAGLSEESLVLAVFAMEKKLERWEVKARNDG